ncbi:MAG: hypothetical protein OEX14_01205, partial [Paracoccaceae bacterium]|nr:hypothetical protein [Paracoccaceae bacterium]
LYQDLVSELEVDGSLRDIYAFKTTVDDWNRLLSLSSSLGEFAYFCDGEEAPLPSTANSIFDDPDHSHLLRINLGGPFINTHFFVADEIEFDLDPSEITSQADLDLVLNFCARIGQEIKRDIVITPENLPEVIYLCYLADQDKWQRLERP